MWKAVLPQSSHQVWLTFFFPEFFASALSELLNFMHLFVASKAFYVALPPLVFSSCWSGQLLVSTHATYSGRLYRISVPFRQYVWEKFVRWCQLLCPGTVSGSVVCFLWKSPIKITKWFGLKCSMKNLKQRYLHLSRLSLHNVSISL